MTYTVSGNQLLDNGKPIQLFGINLVGAEGSNAIIDGLWSGATIDSFLDQIKGLGFNAVRIPITNRTLMNVEIDPNISATWNAGNANLVGKRSMEVMDILIAGLEKRGMRYILDLHYKEAGFPGEIPPKWYTAKYSETAWLKDLKVLAVRYRSTDSAKYPGFVGIDLKNEPNSSECTWGDGNLSTDWKMAAEKAYAAISSYNTDIIVIVEWLGTVTGLKQMVDKRLSIPRNKLALSPHIYLEDVWSGPGWKGEGFDAANFPANMPAIWSRMFGDVAQTDLVIIGEFGGFYGTGKSGMKDKLGQDALAAYCKAKNIPNVFCWQFGPNSGDTGGILNDDWKTVREDKMAMLKTMRTANCTYTTDAVTPAPGPNPVTPVTPTPGPSKFTFKEGDVLRHRSGEGPKFLVVGEEKGNQTAEFWNPALGGFQTILIMNPIVFKLA